MKFPKFIFSVLFLLILSFYQNGCNYLTHRTLSVDNPYDSNKSDQDPNYNVSLDFNYQDFTSYLYPGNRVENFTAYFNTFYRSQEDFNAALDEYRASLISFYNRKLDSLGVTPGISGSVKEKLDKAIERSSKIIQFHKNSKFIDDAVLIIGKSYYYETDYYKAERTFNEFLSKFSSSELADEAILFLAKTKVRLGKTEEGIKILKDLVEKSDDNEVQSQAARDLGILAYNRRSYADAVNYFKASIDYSKDKERKAEAQFILAKILSEFKPGLAATEYKKVVDFTSDFDLLFYSKLNHAKGLIINKDFKNASDELTDLRKKFRDEPAFTQLVDLEIANNLYGQKNYKDALNKYYEVIVKYPNSSVSSDAYYSLAKHEENVNNNYLGAFVNYKKAVEESSSSDYYKESSTKSETFDKYFKLLDEVGDTSKIKIPTENAEVEKYRRAYDEEKGIKRLEEENKGEIENPENGEPPKTHGKGKGKPGGYKIYSSKISDDSLKEKIIIPGSENKPPGENERGKLRENKEKNKNDSLKSAEKDTLNPENDSLSLQLSDSLKAVQDSAKIKLKEDKVFNAYYELAEIFIYNLNQKDSAEHYLKVLLEKFPESERQAKLLYTLGNFYKNNDRKQDADETFEKIISKYPNTVYASESRKILGIKSTGTEFTQSPVEQYFKQALDLFNENKYSEAVNILNGLIEKYPNDSLSAKAIYGIGWVYENKLFNRDSSIFYYKKLKEKFPGSQYTEKINPKLEYIASLEVKDSTGAVIKKNDSTDADGNKIINEGAKNDSLNIDVKKEENTGEIKIDTNNTNEKNKLSQEEIDKMLKETETTPDPK